MQLEPYLLVLAVHAAVDDTVTIGKRDVTGDEDSALDLVGIIKRLRLRGFLGGHVHKAVGLDVLGKGAFGIAVLLGGGRGEQGTLLGGERRHDALLP